MRGNQPREMAIEEPGWEGCHDLEIEQMLLWPRMVGHKGSKGLSMRERTSTGWQNTENWG